MTDYSLLLAQAEALTDGIAYREANLANLSALLYQSLENVNWAGFYALRDGQLVLGPFQGKPACVLLPLGKGVCAAAAREDRRLRAQGCRGRDNRFHVPSPCARALLFNGLPHQGQWWLHLSLLL